VVGRSRLAALAAVSLLSATPLRAQTPILLTPEQYDPAKVLPPPPLRGSARERSEILELEHVQATANPAQHQAAAWDDEHEDPVIFASVIGPGFDMAKLPATAALFHLVIKNESKASSAAKKFFQRDRPWIVDPGIRTCTPHEPGPQKNSYPGGHASVGYAMAVVLSSLMPGKSKVVMERARVFAENRIVCGYHYRSDNEAGRALGTLVANDLMRAPGFKAPYQAAAAELRAAHLTP
jgi:acid phosphatase (class A)